MSVKHLPTKAAEIAGGQGWGDESLIIHLMGFINENVGEPDDKLAE